MTRKDDTKAAYASIISAIFARHYRAGMSHFDFERTEIVDFANELGISVPKNVGDVVYSFRYRKALPEAVSSTASPGHEWIIVGAGIGRYVMKLVPIFGIAPREDLLAIKIPDATPEIIAARALNDEQALLARVRYNRLVDIFLGLTAYSLQNHLRTTVKDLGQIEIDEIYVAVDRSGVQYIVPVQAKTGKDRHSVVQTAQDIAFCAARYPDLTCRAVSAQFTRGGVIAMFELTMDDGEIKIVQERHYKLVPADAITGDDLKLYRGHSRQS